MAVSILVHRFLEGVEWDHPDYGWLVMDQPALAERPDDAAIDAMVLLNSHDFADMLKHKWAASRGGFMYNAQVALALPRELGYLHGPVCKQSFNRWSQV